MEFLKVKVLFLSNFWVSIWDTARYKQDLNIPLAGQIDLDEGRGTIEIKVFEKEKEVVQISSLVDAISGHGGGDEGLVKATYEYVTTGYTEGVTSLDASIESHLIGFAVEESRLSSGKLTEIKH